MGSTHGAGIGSKKRGAPACIAMCLLLLLLLLRCSPGEARRQLLVEEDRGNKVMYFEAGLVLRVDGGGGGVVESSPATRRGFSVSGRAERIMRSVPSPGIGH
ncbi:hypothetical protein GUJ93_ZPchr0005g15050 [Zizania palustris]|uniref:Uncharacterized protein n=1 Tax=Zizania palustris TaxID=103762 RepID=A0A8J5T485_ZIZPA|nr:hypothetical protein GUJ93_ZPchr0005g15050 [Zizania palustris]